MVSLWEATGPPCPASCKQILFLERPRRTWPADWATPASEEPEAVPLKPRCASRPAKHAQCLLGPPSPTSVSISLPPGFIFFLIEFATTFHPGGLSSDSCFWTWGSK